MPKYKSIQFAIESVQAHCQEMISDLFGDVVRAELERAATFEIKRAFEHMKWEEIVSQAIEQFRRDIFLSGLANDFAAMRAEDRVDELEENKLWGNTNNDGLDNE